MKRAQHGESEAGDHVDKDSEVLLFVILTIKARIIINMIPNYNGNRKYNFIYLF